MTCLDSTELLRTKSEQSEEVIIHTWVRTPVLAFVCTCVTECLYLSVPIETLSSRD